MSKKKKKKTCLRSSLCKSDKLKNKIASCPVNRPSPSKLSNFQYKTNQIYYFTNSTNYKKNLKI